MAKTKFEPLLMSGGEVNDLLKSHDASLLLIDARPFSEYAVSHICGALNVKLSGLLVRRLSAKKIQFEDIVNDDQKAVFLERTQSGSPKILVYADNWDEAANAGAIFDCKNPVHVLYGSIRERFSCFLLKGGFVGFKAEFPDSLEASDADLSVPPATAPMLTPTSTQSPTGKVKVVDLRLSEVLPFLYVGSQRDALDRAILKAHHIDYVLNLTVDIPNAFEDDPSFHYLRIPIKDTWNQNLNSHFEAGLEFIRRARDSNSKILVHCMAGISRSPAFVIAFLIQDQKIKVTEAFSRVKSKRAIIAPNLDFMGELQSFERKCFGLQEPGNDSQSLRASPFECGEEDHAHSKPLEIHPSTLAHSSPHNPSLPEIHGHPAHHSPSHLRHSQELRSPTPRKPSETTELLAQNEDALKSVSIEKKAGPDEQAPMS